MPGVAVPVRSRRLATSAAVVLVVLARPVAAGAQSTFPLTIADVNFGDGVRTVMSSAERAPWRGVAPTLRRADIARIEGTRPRLR
ncbi:MAG: hypothetical protein M3401_16950 [Actinomycetota bacterium]|nr:hypothetical protein [Actinomycetota bacterium]